MRPAHSFCISGRRQGVRSFHVKESKGKAILAFEKLFQDLTGCLWCEQATLAHRTDVELLDRYSTNIVT
ncbi:hypothetical protein Pelo_19894 [Pelomyxa schiedti]|nr:hypothetical protein Pelo_19894 [Pelomyxa schiedti]